MPNFLLIEPSLTDLGGHYFGYAALMLQAAEESGFAPILATHVKFKDQAALPQLWPVHPLFTARTCWLHQLPRSFPNATPAAIDALRHRCQNCVRQSYQACHHLLNRVPLEAGDQVFLSTICDLELGGLQQFLQDHPSTRLAQWNLQFHYAIFSGTEDTYEGQLSNVAVIARRFERLLAACPDHRIRFFATTQRLADQYNLLGVTHFRELPVPVNDLFFQRRQTVPAASPLRVAFAGRLRSEKGAHQLGWVAKKLAGRKLLHGRVQLVVQATDTSEVSPLAESIGQRDRETLSTAWHRGGSDSPLLVAPWPLPIEDYVRFICDSDIGLLLYDNQQYYVRSSGVLVEMLAAGVPVIVLADNWLADQLAAAQREYLELLVGQYPPLACVAFRAGSPLGDVARDITDADTAQMAGAAGQPGQIVAHAARSPDATDAILEMRAKQAGEQRMWLRLTLLQWDSNRRLVRGTTIAPDFSDGVAFYKALRLEPVTAWLSLVEHSAADRSGGEAAVGDVRFLFFNFGPAGIPHGAVGLVAGDIAEVPALIDHLVAHYGHFKHTALAHADTWSRLYSAKTALSVLLDDHPQHHFQSLRAASTGEPPGQP